VIHGATRHVSTAFGRCNRGASKDALGFLHPVNSSMNHAAHYTALMNRALFRQWTAPLTGYKERHHILPRSMGGTNDPANLVDLTLREHLVAHLLLAHMPGNEGQWASVQAIMQDTLNQTSPRFGQLRHTRFKRKRIAYAEAKRFRNAQRKRALTRYNAQLHAIEQTYVDTLFDAAGMAR